MTLEGELNDVLRAARLDEKQRRAVSRRLGWDGRPPTTLAAAGAGEGYTRERVRQLEQRVLEHMERTRPALPLAAAALAAIHTHAPASRGELTRTLMEARLTERPFDPLGVLRAASSRASTSTSSSGVESSFGTIKRLPPTAPRSS
jgi:Sigma-70, region 4